MKSRIVALALAAVCAWMSCRAMAADLTQAHDPLQRTVGTPSWNYDTGWLGINLSVIGGGVYVRLSGGLGGTVFDLALNGLGKFTFPTSPFHGDLWFQGTTGYAAQDIGLEMSGQYKITVLGTDYTGNLPYVPNTDIRLRDTKNFTPYMLGQSVSLSDSISNQNLYVYHIGSPGIFSGDIGVSLSASDTVKIDFKRINTDKAVFTVENERKDVAAPDPTLTVGDIYEVVGLAPTLTFTPNIIVGITILGIPFDLTIPTFPIDVPLASLLQPEYTTSPSRSITFTIPPTVTAFAINNGAAYTFSANVTLNNASTNSPSSYEASEDAGFAGASWLPYSTSPAFALSSGDGAKLVYLKTQNGAGESAPVSDGITLITTPPTADALLTNDPTPELTGTVPAAGAAVSVTVAGQTLSATNNGDGTWTLPNDALAPLAEGTYDVAVRATDPAGNFLIDATANELVVDLTPPSVTVDTLVTVDTTPALSGTVDDPSATIMLTVNGQTLPAANLGDGRWSLAGGMLAPLPSGTYDVQAAATDTAGNTGYDATTDELFVDNDAPIVTVYPKSTNDTTPELTGTVSDLSSVIVVVTVSGQSLPATVNGNGTWTLPNDALSALSEGVYDVQVAAMDALGNIGYDATTDELDIDLTPPVVTVNFKTTNDTTPELTGTVDDGTATIVVSLGVQSKPAVNYTGENRWVLPDNTLSPLSPGTYNVHATATDPAGNVGTDTTLNELRVDVTPPTVTMTQLDSTPTGKDSVAYEVRFSELVAPTFAGVALQGTLAGSVSVSITGSDPAYTVTLTPANPDANGTIGIRINADTVKDRAGNACAATSSALYSIQNWCGFGMQPQSKRLYVGGTHTFLATVACGGVPWAYQWKWDDGGKTIHDGPAASTWTITNATQAHRGLYWCEVTYDGVVHSSNVASLDVEPLLVITGQPQGGHATLGASYSFSVLATGGYQPLLYQWSKDGTPLPGATDAELTIVPLQETDSGVYTVEVIDDNGLSVTSNQAVLAVLSGLPVDGRAASIALGCLLVATAFGFARVRSRRSHG